MATSADMSGTDRIGVAAVNLLVEKKLRWAFREQPTVDFGIDAQAEAREPDGKLSGRLVALQIKAGASYFKNRTKVGIIYRGDASHLDYWTRHSLPVLIVLHDPETEMTIWEVISKDTITRAKKAWKVTVPYKHVLNASARRAWSLIAEGSAYQRRLRAFVLAKPWLNLIRNDGKRLFLEFSEWIHKSSGRGSMRLLATNDDEKEQVVEDWGETMFPGQIYQELVLHLFPWATLSIDEEFYEPYDEAEHIAASGHFDGGELVMTSDSLSEWRKRQPRLRPYEVELGEVARFRLELQINKLGLAFLRLDEYLENGEVPIRDEDRDMSLAYGVGLKSLTREYGIPLPTNTDNEE